MTTIPVSFDAHQFDRIFPFHILINRSKQIQSVGKSLAKLGSFNSGEPFESHFKMIRPHFVCDKFEDLLALSGQLIVLKLIDDTPVSLRMQIEYIPSTDNILFIGAPWLDTIDELATFKLSLNDFAVYDPTVDMLHLLKTKDIAHDDIKELLRIVNSQRDELKRISLVASANENGVIFADPCGIIRWVNTGFTRLTGYSFDDAIGKTPVELCSGMLSDNNQLQDMIDRFNAGLNFESEIIFYRQNGTWFWGRVKGQSVMDSNGKVVQYFAIIEDITKERKTKNEIKQQEEKFRRIIANMNLGMVEVDLNDKIQYVNQSFCNMSGYEHSELMGQNAAELFTRGRFKEMVEEVEKRRSEGRSDAYEILVTLKNGDERWWLISGAPLYNNDGEIIGSLGIHLDITDQKLLQQQLEIAKKDAENSANAKQTFLANMSHEIRTPMNAILGMSRQLQKTELNVQQRSFLKIIGDAAENLLVIINDILDFSKIDAGKVMLEEIGFNMEELIRNSIHMLKHKAEEKGLQLLAQIDSSVSPVLIGDPYRINQMIMNLLGNSLKFTSRGKVQIQCNVCCTTNQQQHIKLIISDTGKGMGDAFLKTVFFSKFSQEDESIARSYGGTGLGMSIVKQLVELMNGAITVESKKGQGTEISILLPLTIGIDNDLPKKDKIEIDSNILAGKKILLVEDNEMNRCVAETILSEYGAKVTEAVNGVAAVEAVGNDTFDVVLMDMQMPVMDGIKATGIIRSEISLSLPIIALTANAVKGEMEKCLEAGMNDYLSKPFEEEDLIRIIGKWVKKE